MANEDFTPDPGTIVLPTARPPAQNENDFTPDPGSIILPGQQAPAAPAGWGGTLAGGLDVTLSPILLFAIFLLVRALLKGKRPSGADKTAKWHLGVWPRLMIVLSIFWCAVLTGFVMLVNRGANFEATFPLLLWTYVPICVLWSFYVGARWVRQGA